ncbi:MAG: ribonucleoside-diphosphate reductase, partial [Eubacteriales bacterium]|nr:ribonucleoside-diphosphate reductase [Eubacteriales bacterium]
HSYRVSALMAERVGAFAKFDLNKEHMMRVMRNHARAAGSLDSKPEGLGYNLPKLDHGLLRQLNFGDLSEVLRETWTECLAAGEEYGYRNAQVSVMAPTGTISFAMDCASTSIEPFFSHVVYKKLVGGGFMKLANPLIKQALLKLGYTAAEASEIEGYIMREEDGMLVDGKFEGAPHLKPEHYPILDTANAMGTGERFIHHLGHVKMVAAISPLISGAISKTVNLPSWATVEDFAAVVLEAWKLGVKGITLYRDGSKFAQPLNLKLQGAEADELPLAELSYHELLRRAEEQQEEIELMSRHHISRRDKLSGVRSGRTHPAQIDDVKIYCTVNRNEDGEIAEIYITTDREGTLIMGLLNSLSKTISVMLQYHIPAKDIAKMLRGQKYEPYGFVSRHPHIKFCSSISDLIAKIIDIESGDFSRVQIKEGELPDSVGHNLNVKGEDHGQRRTIGNEHFVHVDAVEAAKNGEKLYDSICPDCSSSRMVRNGTCKVCLDCGATTGCS